MHPGGRCRVRRPDGGRARPLCRATGSAAAAGLLRRDALPDAFRRAASGTLYARTSGPAGLRVQAGGHLRNLFLHFAPHEGWRHVEFTGRRTELNVAYELRAMADVHFPLAEVIRLVWDNLNVHTLAVLYLAFPPAEARRIARKFELHYTPKHGSWLNMCEIEWSVLSRQCLGQRLPNRLQVETVVDPWEEQRNASHATVTWRFTSENARTRLARLYPPLPS